MTLIEFNLDELDAAIARQRTGKSLSDEAEELSGSLVEFVKAAWHVVVPNTTYVHGWHIDAICEHLEAVSAGETRRLQIWVPPGTMKSTTVSILWPVWEWATRPELRYLTASYELKLAGDFAVKSRDLLRSVWFQSRWPHVQLKRDQDLKQSYANTAGGIRIATSPGGAGTGRHADRIIIDDALNAREIASEAALEEVADWHDGTMSTRWADPKTGCEVIIQQRLAERDLPGHLLDTAAYDWTVLCLPEEYEPSHPYAWDGDPREAEGELLWPERVGPVEHASRLVELGAHRAAGQLQQRPSAREGSILKRGYWQWYRPQARDESDEAFVQRLPKFEQIVQSWDTSLKDSAQSDKVAGTVWGKIGSDLYLLGGRHERMNLSATKQAVRDLTGWAEKWWPQLPQRILVEKQSNGVEVIAELQRELRGIIATRPSVSADRPPAKKTIRAEAASPALEAGNIFLPGMASSLPEGYDSAQTSDLAQQLVEQCATFPTGSHDDLVDSFTQAVNWTRGMGVVKSSLSRPGAGRLIEAGHLPALAGRPGFGLGR